MIFHSAELRWFSSERDKFWDLFEQASPKGQGIRESDRTDHYLKIRSKNSGIKIREGNHEIKVCTQRKNGIWGKIEEWTKWSYPEEENILKLLSSDQLQDWMALKKRRWNKKYEVNREGLQFISKERIPVGCGFEFTQLEVPSLGKTIYTLGFEAFNQAGNAVESLLFTLDHLNFIPDQFRDFEVMSYPAFLLKLLSDD